MSEILRPLIGKLLATAGFQELPGGLIIKWGEASATITNKQIYQGTTLFSGTIPVVFPTPFPNGVLTLTFANLDHPTCSGETCTHGNLTAAGFTLYPSAIPTASTQANALLGAKWIAIGW